MSPRWPVVTGTLTAAWSFAYGAAGLAWTLDAPGYPFAVVHEDRTTMSLLEGTPVEVVGPILCGLGLFGGVVALLMTFRPPQGRRSVLVFGWLLAVTLALLIPDFTLLAMIAFAPAIVVFIFTGVPGPQELGDIVYWHRLNLLIVFAGGVLWAFTTLAYQRRSRGACLACGSTRVDPAKALRWGRWAVAVAVLSTIPYELTRAAWYFGWPLGITDEFHQMMVDTPGMLEIGLAMALASIGGSLLTHGLVRPWGEVYPRWIWFRAGRRVPPRLAIIPAGLVALALVPAGLMNLRLPFEEGLWALNGPGVLWTVWGVALGVATYAYHLRRRTACAKCGATSRSAVPAGHSSE
ncbi:NYN domain-containing protein [Kribbella deserti]|uniref:NYN domain-containing protein n=1 Tax=Kribbella deserti TaxID=1926257 RepID=A0ABV6QMR8_9ACTN